MPVDTFALSQKIIAMKKILVAICLLTTVQAMCQGQQGTINYEVTTKLDIDLEGDMAAFADMIPKEQKSSRVLYYSPEATLYKSAKKEAEEQQMNVNGMDVNIQVDEPENTSYLDMQNKTLYHKTDFMGRDFLIIEEVEQADWKMTGAQKEILGYPCQEATSIDGEDTVVAWFTSAIPVPSGPSGLGTLPGMILEAYIGSMVHIVATGVSEGVVNEGDFVKPKGGKKLTKEEFDEIVAEKTREMQEQYGGSGNNGIIRMQVTQER